jgi:outer membrane protein TolC
MMRWKHGFVGLALTIAAVAGCKQQCFLNECDYKHYQDIGLTERLQCDPKASIQPTTVAVPTPSTVLDPERKIRYLSLAEAIAIALEQGRVGDQDPSGTTLTSLINIGIPAASDTIRVLSLDPAISATDIEASLAKFDVQWTTAMTWSATDQPVNGLNQFQSGTNAQFQSSLLKPLPTGGVSGITFSTQYQQLSNPPRGFTLLNPNYTPRLQFQFEQPLLQGFGVEINQLRPTHPGSVLTPFSTGGRVPGILITRLRFDEQRAEFERRVHLLLRNVETSYWNLYNAYWLLYSREQAYRQAYELWKITRAQFQLGKVAMQDLAQARQQYEAFRAQRISAMGSGTFVPPLGLGAAPGEGLLERERTLRNLLGLPVEDGTRLVPIDAPTLTPYRPDWNTAVNEALALRPELVIARNDLKFQQLNLMNVKNLLLPDLRFTSTYALNGIGNTLDGTVDNALRSLASDRFTDWSMGLRLNYVLGYRDAHAQLRVAKLNLARSYAVLQEQETKAQHAVAVDYRHLFEFYELILIQRAQRLAAADQLRARLSQYQSGVSKVLLPEVLEAQRVWADALRSEFDAIVQYNNAIVGFEFSKGTIMQFDNVVIAEGALPHCAQVRAVEHERERSKAIVLRERANPVLSGACDFEKGCFGVPELPANEVPTLPKVFDGQPPVPVITEPMPDPKVLSPTAAKPESPSKASSPQTPTTGGVLGFIIAVEPPDSTGPAATADKSPHQMPPGLPPTLPETNHSYGNPAVTSPNGKVGSSKRS